jgi:hypothetical protein
MLLIDDDIAALKHLAREGGENTPYPCRPRWVSRRNSWRTNLLDPGYPSPRAPTGQAVAPRRTPPAIDRAAGLSSLGARHRWKEGASAGGRPSTPSRITAAREYQQVIPRAGWPTACRAAKRGSGSCTKTREMTLTLVSGLSEDRASPRTGSVPSPPRRDRSRTTAPRTQACQAPRDRLAQSDVEGQADSPFDSAEAAMDASCCLSSPDRRQFSAPGALESLIIAVV